ncbi:methyl-accepting chemotaxis protein [Desulfolithobacter sp.]
MQQKIKRKKLNLTVKKELQKWLLIRITGIVLLCSLVAALILYFYARSEITSSFFDAHLKIRRVSDLLLPVLLTGSAVSMVAGLVLAMFLPQKIAGPVYRIEKDLEEVQKGELTKVIHLRKGDLLMDLADEVNKATASVRQLVQEIKDNYRSAEKAVRAGDDAQVEMALHRLEESLSRLKT